NCACQLISVAAGAFIPIISGIVDDDRARRLDVWICLSDLVQNEVQILLTEPPRVEAAKGIIRHISVGINPSHQSNRIALRVPPEGGLVIPAPVVIPASLRVGDLTRESLIVGVGAQRRDRLRLPERLVAAPLPDDGVVAR